MSIRWSSDLAVGYARIDEQHQQLFRHFDELVEACRQRQGKEKLKQLLAFLDDYVVSHFGEEETLMKQHGYPGYEEHCAEHGRFKEKLREIERLLHEEGPSINVLVETNETVLRWLIGHIRKIDLQLAAFLQTRS